MSTHMQPQFFGNSLYIPFSYQKVTPEVWAGVSMATVELVSRGWEIGVLNCHNSLLPKFNIFFIKHSPTYVLSQIQNSEEVDSGIFASLIVALVERWNFRIFYSIIFSDVTPMSGFDIKVILASQNIFPLLKYSGRFCVKLGLSPPKYLVDFITDTIWSQSFLCGNVFGNEFI